MSCHTLFTSIILFIVFLWCRFEALVWKKEVFLSPAFNQLFQLLWCHISSSMLSHLFSSLLMLWISSRSMATPFRFSSAWSFLCSPATCFPTWPKLCVFQDFSEAWHSVMQTSKGHWESLPQPLSHASWTPHCTSYPQATWIQNATPWNASFVFLWSMILWGQVCYDLKPK